MNSVMSSGLKNILSFISIDHRSSFFRIVDGTLFIFNVEDDFVWIGEKKSNSVEFNCVALLNFEKITLEKIWIPFNKFAEQKNELQKLLKLNNTLPKYIRADFFYYLAHLIDEQLFFKRAIQYYVSLNFAEAN